VNSERLCLWLGVGSDENLEEVVEEFEGNWEIDGNVVKVPSSEADFMGDAQQSPVSTQNQKEAGLGFESELK